MKEIYYGRIPLSVPLQKAPPSKYASQLYAFYVLGEYGSTVYIESIELRQASFYEYEEIKTSMTNIDSISHTQVLFEPIHLNKQPHEQFKSVTSIAETGHKVIQVLFPPINLSGLPHETTKTENTSIDGGVIVQVLWEPIEYRHIESEKQMSIGTIIDSIDLNSIN